MFFLIAIHTFRRRNHRTQVGKYAFEILDRISMAS